MLCFSYGSNMLRSRLSDRVCLFKRLGAAYLTGYTLRFNKKSTGRKSYGSGKCNVSHTGNPDDRVWGALDCLTEEQFKELDRREDCDYRRVPVRVTFDERKVEACLYVAKPEAVKPNLRPLGWYKRYVLEGAQELKLPSDYIADYIESVPSI